MFDQLFDPSLILELADWKILIYLVVGSLLAVAFKCINGICSGYNLNQELTEKDNKGISFSLAGFLLAIFLIIHSVLTAPSHWIALGDEEVSWVIDLKDSILWSSLGCFLLFFSRFICDKAILPKFSNKRELVEDKNIGVGIVQAANYISTALVIRATLSSPEANDFVHELLLALVWFASTQTILIILAKLYQVLTKYDMHEELRNGNDAVGVAFGGHMIALSLLLSFYISTFDSLVGLVIWAIVSYLLLMIVRFIVDKLILPKHKLDNEIAEDKNWGAGLIEGASAIGAALLISGSFH